MAVTNYDRYNLSDSQISQLSTLTDQWNSAKTQAERDQIHAQANAVRGYSTDDSGYTPYENLYTPDSFIHQAQTFVNESNAVAQANAQAQYDFNSAEAQKSRDWSEYMSSTAHQREVKDLIAAGLNPVLSANAGASVGQSSTASGSVASNNESLNSVFGAYLQSLISSATAINQSNISARTQSDVAAMYNAMDYKIHKDFPQNAWQAFGPELDALMDAAEGYFNKNSASWYSKVSEKASSFYDSVRNWFKEKFD